MIDLDKTLEEKIFQNFVINVESKKVKLLFRFPLSLFVYILT